MSSATDVTLDEKSKHRLASLVQRAEQLLAEAVRSSPDGRAELHLVLVQRGRVLTRSSHVIVREYPAE